ncbi:dTDP-4-amino-4,6-dideoxygalactose transaminase [Paenibacillus sp. J53TS2]|uniref:dTDP-4-amino-4,6-dideoxygalactose transaminase n=1 Tax=Paenibacillus sp. J53TS2 TaxID=2807197 RepID=UPI001B0B8EEC|nr:dTDP-4-amino-4,6-dideoxygalactose transaminase [Paenibacillus sp. J53TS2]GIP47418.1 dTDP-4-amino-4,6-dideoxygalactose transaminase [Paenibacillus sp. J53TS2]
MIPFNVPAVTGNEMEYIVDAIKESKLSGDGKYTKLCSQWLEDYFNTPKALLTTSCTHALEMAAILADIQPGDEVIMPSYTFVSTANAFVLRGAKVVFIDIRPDTMNLDETLIKSAITSRTKAIVPVHYAGVTCDMDSIMEIANQYNLVVIEDAAQAMMSQYKGRYAGTIGHIGCFSFHETKNYNCGEGGAILLNDARFIERAEIIREKGTNRSRFFRGQIDRYSWVDLGSSYLPSELNTAFLYGQFQQAQNIYVNRFKSWNQYYEELKPLAEKGLIELPVIPRNCEHNAHMFYIKTRDLSERSKLLEYLKDHGILAVFHYVPLHSSEAGRVFSRFLGEDVHTTRESERLTRLPMFYGLKAEEISRVTGHLFSFYKSQRHW